MTDLRKMKTKSAIENAMVTLLKNENFENITAIAITKEAGISRGSFYSHYKDKYEMIDIYQQKLFNKLEYIFDKNQYDLRASILEIFEFLDRESLFAALMSENGTKEIQLFIRYKLQSLILSPQLQNHFSTKNLTETERTYRTVYLSNAIFGVYQTWLSRGKKEKPSEMTDILMTFLS